MFADTATLLAVTSAGVAQSRDQLLSCKEDNHAAMLTPTRKKHWIATHSGRMALKIAAALCASIFAAFLVTWGILTHTKAGDVAADCANGPPLLLWGVGMSAGLCKTHSLYAFAYTCTHARSNYFALGSRHVRRTP
jgi:hypothetical protein